MVHSHSFLDSLHPLTNGSLKTVHGPVQIFTYGMPLMASNAFEDAFRHQEKSRKVQHARFYNSNDVGEALCTLTVLTKFGLTKLGLFLKLDHFLSVLVDQFRTSP